MNNKIDVSRKKCIPKSGHENSWLRSLGQRANQVIPHGADGHQLSTDTSVVLNLVGYPR
jgi:hypothetical protein